VKPPTLIIDSGNGYQALWAFETPLRILDAATLDDFRQINRWLCSLKFKGGDKVFAPNHLLRLPYTVNWKRKTSGVYPVASVVSSGGPTYPLTCFGRFADAIDKPSQAAHPVTIDTANLKRLSSLDDLPPTVTPRLKALINCGNVPCELKPDDNSRSAWLFDAVCNLIRARVDDVTIFGIITDTRFGIAASVLDKSKPEEYARKQIEKAHAMAGNESRGIAESDGDFILHEGGKLLESIAKMESVLLNGQGRPIYQRGEFLVRPTTIGTVDHGEKVKGERHTTVDGDAVIRTGGIERVIGTPTIRRVSAGWIQREVASNSHWYKPGAKGNIPIDPPSSIAGHILEKVQYRPEPPSTKQSKFLLLRPASLSA
jgi:hypothetical protein